MKILFVCKSNQFRSQMAAALYNKITNSEDADSAGTYVGADDEPEGVEIATVFKTLDFFEMLEEKDIYIRTNKTKKLVSEMLDRFDKIVAMPEEPFIPDFLRSNSKVLWWEVENPPFATREASEKTFPVIEKHVLQLINDI